MTVSKPRVFAVSTSAACARDRVEIALGVVHANLRLLAEHRELLDRRRTPDVGRHHQRVAAVAGEQPRQLGARRRLARALQAEQQDDARRGGRRRQAAARVAEQRQHLVAHDADDLLGRRQALQDVVVDRPIADAIDERLDDLEVDVGLEQRHANLAQRDLDRLLGEAGLAADLAEDVLEALAEGFEHGAQAHVALIATGANGYPSRDGAGPVNRRNDERIRSELGSCLRGAVRRNRPYTPDSLCPSFSFLVLR